MAGPHVAGAVALMWSANPVLLGDIELTEKLLEQSARKVTVGLPECVDGEEVPNSAVGFGYLDVYEAVRLALQVK